ncbi:beta-lactamase-like protein [Radiomyces spectabilis]|uniref:beta-lactamase-like protein n=1 Tax=Radiomyces spectabilis TaxID=64574 RepID=UPI00221FAE29|nr:beta-lactamase-like protein [Radiomyces spectabilis]KAI8388141.1 beta-lactamase-like protein [Radiomyces spectabilis]
MPSTVVASTLYILRRSIHTTRFDKRFSFVGRTTGYQWRFQDSLLSQASSLYGQRRGMKAYIQVVGQASAEGPPSLIVHYDSQRYMFNCREGTQRLCVEEKVRLSKLKNIFLTRLEWECVGGMIGMLLTLADAGTQNLHIHGGRNLTHLMVATRPFVYRTSMAVETHEFDGNPTSKFSDGNLTVTPVVILPTAASGLPDQSPRKRRRVESASEGSSSESGSDSESGRPDPFEHMSAEQQMAYRRDVLLQMFSNKGPENAPGHTIESPCTPRQHPLSKTSQISDAKIQLIAADGEPLKAEVEEIAPVPDRIQSQPNKRQTAYLKSPLPRTTPYPAAVSYICRGPELPGKFNKQAALDLGVKPGPDYGKLHKGIPVTLADGRVIKPEQVVSPAAPGHLFLVIDCPSVDYIESLTTSSMFKEYQTTDESSRPNLIIHLLGKQVLEDERYRAWMNKFSPKTDHIVGSEEICAQTVQFQSHALQQYKLSRLDKDIFSIPKYNNRPAKLLSEFTGLPPKVTPLSNMMQYDLEPRNGLYQQSLERWTFDHDNILASEVEKYEGDEKSVKAVQLARTEADKVSMDIQFPGADVQIITLGTGSAIPSKTRNVSGTLVKIPGSGSILLDAGEGTYGQMMRHFGREKLDEELNAIRCIFVSHLHADHHLGVMQLLTKWWKLNSQDRKKSLYVVAPHIYRRWLQEYSEVEYFGPKPPSKQIRFIQNERFSDPKFNRAKLGKLLRSLGLKDMQTVEVIHCRWAYGLTLEHESGWKLVYSGDTRPCDSLVEAGRDATLLIHEATLEDSMKAEAIAKRHSTTSEAIDVGKRMNARYTLLNHFSQRYPKVPALSDDQNNVCISFDLMALPIKQLERLKKFTETIRFMLRDNEDEE